MLNGLEVFIDHLNFYCFAAIIMLTLQMSYRTLYGLIRRLDPLDISAVKSGYTTGIASNRSKRWCLISLEKPETAARSNHTMKIPYRCEWKARYQFIKCNQKLAWWFTMVCRVQHSWSMAQSDSNLWYFWARTTVTFRSSSPCIIKANFNRKVS